jgi:hypothetical protein
VSAANSQAGQAYVITVLFSALCRVSLILSLKRSLFGFSVSFYNSSARTTKKTAFIVKEAYLLVRYLAMDILGLHVYTSQKCVYRVVA